ncbi:hypothetical protein HW555_012571 [Spodoptera exigua]|uniref:Zinc finger protein n=1 Tax=Spodoptera exigua TaxID=7107 RepID=A0A835G4X2_SPOEX|nr:hypothetical protein HW555_012571 [Spodoptera exigua]
MDFSKICRTCMQGDPSRLLNPIFMSEDTHDRFSDVIYSCIGIKIKCDDGLPQNMCTICMNLFNTTLKFRKQCKQVETELLKIKTESQSDDDITNNDQFPTTTTENPHYTNHHNPVYINLNKIKCESGSFKTDDDDSNKSFKCNDDTDDDQPCTVKSKEVVKRNYSVNDNDGRRSTSVTEIPYIITENDRKTKRVVCKLCQKELSIRSIDSHMVRRHPGADERKVKCELCDKYVMKDKLNRHRLLTHGAVEVNCGYCKKEFPSKEILINHVGTCPARYKKRKMSENARKISECDICKMKMQRASLQKHKAVKHGGLRPVCEHCGKSFGNKFRLNEHYRAKHGYEKFKCSYCDFQSAGIMAMRNHERRHRGEKPYVCEACGAKFHASYLLVQHRHSHRAEKTVKCELCPATFKANNNLHMHKLTCHSKAYYSCLVCTRSYKCKYYALKHVRLTHSLYEPPSVIKLVPQR